MYLMYIFRVSDCRQFMLNFNLKNNCCDNSLHFENSQFTSLIINYFCLAE